MLTTHSVFVEPRTAGVHIASVTGEDANVQDPVSSQRPMAVLTRMKRAIYPRH